MLFPSLIKLLLVGLDIGLLVLFRHDYGPVRLTLSKRFPVRLNMIEKLLQFVFGTHLLNRHRRLIAGQDRHVQVRILVAKLG